MASLNDPMIRTSDLVWPISYQFLLDTPFGPSQQELTVHAPFLVDNLEASARLGPLLWQMGLASASTRGVQLQAVLMMAWKAQLVPSLIPPVANRGEAWGSSSSRAETGVMVMHTGHMDSRGRRRLFFPGMPQHWAKDGVLTKDGAEQLQSVGRGLIVGLGAATGAWELQWMLAYPRMFEGLLMPAEQVGFRFVNHIRVCLFTERAPDPPSTPWPG